MINAKAVVETCASVLQVDHNDDDEGKKRNEHLREQISLGEDSR